MSICARCNVKACSKGDNKVPKWCKQNDEAWKEKILGEYKKPEINSFYTKACQTEKNGYCKWTRLEEIMEFCSLSGFSDIGLAFCIGFKKEAAVVEDVLRSHGLKVHSAVCCIGGIDKEDLGVKKEHKLSVEGFEAACNPIGQAEMLNRCGPQLNIALGLCVGHDSLFFKYSDAPVTVLAAKDRVLGHNPMAAVYCADSYYKKKLYR
jgi:uncharacterized metal-binding protein